MTDVFALAIDLAHRRAVERVEYPEGSENPNDRADAMQAMLAHWQAEMFGEQVEADVKMTLGIVEEIGEGFEAENSEKTLDALGDVIVYAGQIAHRNRLAISAILELAGGLVNVVPPTAIVLGRLAHYVLKASQRIRGLDDVERYRRGLVEHLAMAIASAWECAYVMLAEGPIDAASVYVTIGGEVLQRKKGDPMIPTTPTVPDHPTQAQLATAALERRTAAEIRLNEANVALGEAEIAEGPGDFDVTDATPGGAS